MANINNKRLRYIAFYTVYINKQNSIELEAASYTFIMNHQEYGTIWGIRGIDKVRCLTTNPGNIQLTITTNSEGHMVISWTDKAWFTYLTIIKQSTSNPNIIIYNF